MGYCINTCDFDGLSLPYAGVGAEFCDDVARAVAQHYRSCCCDDEAAEKVEARAAKIVAIKDVRKKVDALREFLRDGYYPLIPQYPECEGDPDRFTLTYDWDIGEKWDEDAFRVVFSAFAKAAPRGAYASFVGEDEMRWTYVCDGKGGYKTVRPITFPEGLAFQGERTYREIFSILDELDLLSVGDQTHLRIVCATHAAIVEAGGKAWGLDKVALCEKVEALWADCHGSFGLDEIARMAVKWAEFEKWAETQGLPQE